MLMAGTARSGTTWVDKNILFLRPESRLVKAVRANLFLRWFTLQFPQAPMLMLTRHPCAVALSRIRCGWDPRQDLDTMLSQQDLVDDYLEEYMGTIRDAKSSESQNAVIWSIHHIVPLGQFGPRKLPGIFYEKLRADPEGEWPRVFAALGRVYTPEVKNLINIESATSKLSGKAKRPDWRTQMTPRQIDDVLDVVRSFGLGEIYDDSLMPQSDPFMDLSGLK